MSTYTNTAKLYKKPRKFHTALEDFLMAGYVLFLPDQFQIGIFHLAPSDIFLLAMFVFAALRLIRIKHVSRAWSFWHVGLITSFCMSLPIVLFLTGHVMPYAVLNKVVGLLILFASYGMIVSYADSWERIRRILRILVLTVALQNMLSIVGFVMIRTVGMAIPGLNSAEPRLVGFLIDPNAYGGLLVLTLCVHLLTHYSRKPLVGGMLGHLMTLTLALGTLLTYSRSAWLGLLTLVLVVIVYKPKAGFHLALIGAIALGSILLMLGPQYSSDMKTLSTRQSQYYRMRLIENAFDRFWESPIVGIGMGGYYEKSPTIIHNTPVWILTECGIIGLVLYAGYIIWLMQKGFIAYREANSSTKPLILGLLTAFIAMMGLSLGIEALYQRHLWLIWALIVACYCLQRNTVRIKAVRSKQQECLLP